MNLTESLFRRGHPEPSPRTLEEMVGNFDGTSSNPMIVDPTFQRDYVWSDENRQRLLESIFKRLHIGSIVVQQQDAGLLLVDGLQRLTTLSNFMKGKFPYWHKGKPIFFKNLNARDQIRFLNSVLPTVFLPPELSKQDVLRVFVDIARAGVPQEEAHLNKLYAMIRDLDQADQAKCDPGDHGVAPSTVSARSDFSRR